MAGFFITGTDTDAGKTLVTLALMEKIKLTGHSVAAIKPVAAGVKQYPHGRYNEDAVLLQNQSSIEIDYEAVNPYLFEPPIAPHIAAQKEQVTIELERIALAYTELSARIDYTFVEGAGGWLVPLSADADMSDIPSRLGLSVILVVGMKLGCINHARLTMQAIRSAGCDVSGWIATQVDADMQFVDENIKTLKKYLDAPCLGIIPFLEPATAHAAVKYLSINQLELNDAR